MNEELHQEGEGPPGRTWLNRNVVGMSLTSFLSDLGHETATSILPSFLKLLGAPPLGLGLIEGASDAASSFVKLGAGWWSDRLRNRKPLVAAGYALTGAAVGLFSVATVWPLILVFRFLGWVARGARGPARDAMLSESVTQKDRGKAFGIHRAGDTLGAMVGPLLAAWLLGVFATEATEAADATRPYRVIFLWTLLPGLGAAVAFLLLVREYRHSPGQSRRFWVSMRALPPGFRRFLVGVGVFGAGDFSHTLLILAAVDLLTPVYGAVPAAQWGALLYGLRNALYAAASFPAGALGDRLGHRGLLIAGYLLGGAVMVGFAVEFATPTHSLAMLAVLFGLAGIYTARDSIRCAGNGQWLGRPAVERDCRAALDGQRGLRIRLRRRFHGPGGGSAVPCPVGCREKGGRDGRQVKRILADSTASCGLK